MPGRDGTGETADPLRPPVRAASREVGEASTELATPDDAAVPPTDRADSAGEPAVAPTDPAGSAADAMARLRPDEPAGMQLARARMWAQLFGEDSQDASIGRFVVLQRLGAGAMGVVYEAYDPDLARGVALKLINVAVKNRGAALAEAKALARLSHPNVVQIYDAGITGNRVYLVMELVRGKTLQHWVDGRGAHAILDAYQQAGRALAAAHAAGLVHRDFKPANAIVGADGKVLVVDFGLACEADDPARASSQRRGIAGTPGFMAPEIAAGAAVTPAADQYSFCVALTEALAAARPPAPRRIAALLARGRAPDPADRFASMTELLHALARDPARLWRRRAAAVGVVAAVGATMYFAGKRPADVADPCDAGAAQLDAAWSPGARGAALARIAGLGEPGRALQPLLSRALDDHRAAWARAFHAACVDARGGLASTAQVDRRNLCLTRGVDALDAVRDLVTRAGAGELAQLPLAVQSLPDPAQCSARATLADDTPPPPPALAAQVAGLRHRIGEAQIDVGAGRYDDALWTARFAAAEAAGLGYPPVHAEALLVQGHARMMLDRRGAVPVLAEAVRAAVAAHSDAGMVEAWARRAWAQGTSSDPAGALDGVDLVESIAQRLPPAAFPRALLYNNLASVELAREHPDRAQDYLRRALGEARTITGDHALELLAIRANLGILDRDRRQGDALLVEVAAERAARLGHDHPETLQVAALRGSSTLDDLRAAADALAPACRGEERYPALGVRTSRCWAEAAFVDLALHDRGAALAAFERAAAAAETLDVAAYVTLLRGDAAAAGRQFAAALAATPPAADARWWDRLWRGKLALGLGEARRAAGDASGALRALETSVDEMAAVVRGHPSPDHERRLGVAQLELARTLAATGAPPAQRTAAAAAALAWLTRVAGPADDIAEMTALVRGSARSDSSAPDTAR